jgi:hypothetical protein
VRAGCNRAHHHPFNLYHGMVGWLLRIPEVLPVWQAVALVGAEAARTAAGGDAGRRRAAACASCKAARSRGASAG